MIKDKTLDEEKEQNFDRLVSDYFNDFVDVTDQLKRGENVFVPDPKKEKDYDNAQAGAVESSAWRKKKPFPDMVPCEAIISAGTKLAGRRLQMDWHVYGFFYNNGDQFACPFYSRIYQGKGYLNVHVSKDDLVRWRKIPQTLPQVVVNRLNRRKGNKKQPEGEN